VAGEIDPEEAGLQAADTHPKPRHRRDWRDILTELAIVVVGVGVALAAQQAAEWLHDRAKAAEARATIREEIARNLGYMVRRDVTEACTANRLDEVDGLIAASAAGKLPQDALWIGMPVMSTMVDGRYKAAVQSGAFSLLSNEEQGGYGFLFGAFEKYNRETEEEMQDWANLRTLEKHPPASPTLDWQLRSALQMARTHRYALSGSVLTVMTRARSIGITPREYDSVKMPATCVPLHTPREGALKLTFEPTWNIAKP
jgi:hypothetical protein